MNPESLNNMIRSVVRDSKWIPEVIDNLFVDKQDHHGLLFWYYDLIEVHKELKASQKK